MHWILLLFFADSLADLVAFKLTVQKCKRYSLSNRPSQDCSGEDLISPPHLFSDVVSLNLARNALNYIESFPETYSDLISLRLDDCQIEKIDIKAIGTLRNMKHLDLSHNNLRHIVFSAKNRGLTTLNLSHNKLRHLPDLSSLTSLRLLDLSHNELLTINPAHLPYNIESLRLTGNGLTYLTPWPHLAKLQELDVSLNPLACECPLWRFVSWAENFALFDSSTLPCLKPATLRRNLHGDLLCGPEVFESNLIDRRRVNLGETQQLCCTVASSPDPTVFWTHNDKNFTYVKPTVPFIQTSSERAISDSGQMRYCIVIVPSLPSHLGSYRCVVDLEGKLESKEFFIDRYKSPLAFKSGEHLLLYAQVSMCIFITVFFCGSFYFMRRQNSRKTRPDKSFGYSQIPIIRTMEACPPVIHISPPATPTYEEWNKTQLEIWRQRMARLPAPLAEFDADTTIMPLIHTAV